MGLSFNNITFTGENIFDYVTPEEIMVYYFGEFEVGKKYYCPFEKEKTPSFWIGYINGKLKWVRFGMFDNRSYSPVDFVKFKFKVSFREAVDMIYKDLYVSQSVIKTDNIIKQELVLLEGRTSLRKWESYDVAYWTQYQLTLKELQKYNVYPGDSYWIISENRSAYKKFANKPDCPMYIYKHGEGFTCYRPYAEKENKFRKHLISGDIMGWDQLPFIGDEVAITSSLKDIMVLSKIGVPAVAPHSEVSGFPRDKIEELKSSFKRVVVVYDNDSTGVSNSIKLTKKYDLDYWNVPNSYKGCTDPSDLVKKHGLNTLKQLWKKH